MKTQLITITSICLIALTSQSQTFNNVGTSYVGTGGGTNSQLQTALDNQLMIQGGSAFLTPVARNVIKVGIGYFPANNVLDRLHIHDNSATSTTVAVRFTNITTGITATDGFNVGINANGHAYLFQRENLPIRFGTNALERMRILANGNVGINNTTGNNRLEITSGTGNPYFPGSSSGLRFTNLLSTATPITNPGTGVLSIDANGDVIYVPASVSSFSCANNGLGISGGCMQLGGNCGSAAASALLNNRETPMAGFNLNYTMPLLSPSQFIIGGQNCSTFFPARFLVNNDFYRTGELINSIVTSNTQVYAGIFNAQNLGTGNVIGVNATVLASNTSANAIAVNGNSSGNLSSTNLGVNATARNASFASISLNADVIGSSSPINQGHNTEIFSSSATSNNSGANITVNTPGNTNYGVYAYAGGANFNAAIYGTTPIVSTSNLGTNWAGYFNGSVIVSAGNYFLSDKRLKKEVKTLNNSIEIIKKLNPVTYLFDQDNHTNITLGTNKQYGFISQEVNAILPELTSPVVVPASIDSTGNQLSPREEYLGLNYQGFTAIMVDAIKTQQQTIEAQQAQINELKNLVKAITASDAGTNSKTANLQTVNLSDAQTIVLEQNVPNPFAEQTTIGYVLNEGVQKAQILFHNINGKLINTSELKTTAGKGILNVFANDLSNGLYSYSLIVDDKLIETKRMVKSK
jgi:hypothetical protein